MITWSSTALPALEHNAMLWNMMPRQKQKFVQILTINLNLKLYFFFIAEYRQWAESSSASYRTLFAQCFLFIRDLTKTLSIFFGKLLKITYWKDVEGGYVFFLYCIVESEYCSNNPSSHSDPSYPHKFLSPDFSFPLWQVFQNVNKHFLSYYCASSW